MLIFDELQEAAGELFGRTLQENSSNRKKSITLILSILRLDEKTSELRQIDKHVHFDSNLVARPTNRTGDQPWTYKLSVHSFSRLLYRFRITCSPNYHGEDCSRFCRQRDDLFGHYSCDREGKQICLDGWQGEQCDRPICAANCSLSNGYCKQPNECICKPGYRGADCADCVPHQACVNGYCHLPNQCLCRPNWGGIFCDQDLNLCASHRPCLNNGLCRSAAPNQYKCICPAGYGGTNCELVLDVCRTRPCLNGGSCRPGGGQSTNKSQAINGSQLANYGKPTSDSQPVDSFECICPPRWTGERCEIGLNACAQRNPCAPNGQCVDTEDGGYQCRCDRGFTGPNCDQNIDECVQTIADSGCVATNTERCIDTIGSFECRCLPGWSGKYCQMNIDDCASNPCLNQAQCIDLVNDYQCLCAKGLKGKNCGQFDESVCSGDVSSSFEETVFFENDLEPGEQSQYWQIESEAKLNRSSSCRSRWCSCSSEESSDQTTARRLHCVCVRPDEYEQLNRRQLEKLNLALQPAVDQLMLVNGEDLAQQDYLLGQLPLKLQKQISSGELVDQAANRTDAQSNGQQLGNWPAGEQRIANQLEENKSNKEIISEILIDGELDTGDDRFVSIALNFGQKLHSGQVQSICASMLAIYSLVRRQPDLGQLNFACKANELPQSTTIRFYTLDNDERVLSVAGVVARSLSGVYKLNSILKRTHRSTGSDGRLSRWKLHCLLVMNVCLLFWAVVVVIMIGILLSSHNERLRSAIGRSRLLNAISLQLNRRLYGRTEEALDNKTNHIVIHNNLNARPKNEYALVNSKPFDQQLERTGRTVKPTNRQIAQQNQILQSKLALSNVQGYGLGLSGTKKNDPIREYPTKLKNELEVSLAHKPPYYEQNKSIQPVHL